MFTAPFWKAAAERALRTIAQTLLALWVVADGVFNALAVDWGQALGVGLGAGILSLLTSLTAEWVQPATGPSLGTEKPVTTGTRKAEAGALSWDMVAAVAIGGTIAGVVLWLLGLAVGRM